jgi:hypothetical protein
LAVTRPIAYSVNGRSRLTWALMPSSRLPDPVAFLPSAASNAIAHARGAVRDPCQPFQALKNMFAKTAS